MVDMNTEIAATSVVVTPHLRGTPSRSSNRAPSESEMAIIPDTRTISAKCSRYGKKYASDEKYDQQHCA